MFIQYLPLVALAFIAYIALLRGSTAESAVPERTRQSRQQERGSTVREEQGGGDALYVVLFLAGALGIILMSVG